MGHHRHLDQAAAALVHSAVGPEPGSVGWRDSHLLRRHRTRPRSSWCQRLRWRRPADQRHRDPLRPGRRLVAERRRPAGLELPALRLDLRGGDHRARSTSVATSSSSRSPGSCTSEPCYPDSRTSATAPVRVSRATAWATPWPRRPPRCPQRRQRTGAGVVLGVELLRGGQGHGGHSSRFAHRR